MMENVQIAETRKHVRVQFDLEGTRKEQNRCSKPWSDLQCLESVVSAGPGAAGMTSSGRVVPFVKASACGNDFLIIDGQRLRSVRQDHRRISADASATATRASAPTAWSGCFPRRMPMCRPRLFNADGSEAEISGNGTRCVAAYLCSEAAPGEKLCDPHRSRSQDLHADLPQRIQLRVRNRHGRTAGRR